MMEKMKIKKGDYGYLNHQKKIELAKTLILFAVAIAVFFIGYINTGKKENIFTVIAILGMLPACRNAVTVIMFFRFPTGKKEVYDKVNGIIGSIPVYYDAVITTTGKSYPVNVFCCEGGNLLGYSEKTDFDVKLVEKHLKEMAKNNELKGLAVKIFTDLDKYLARVEELNRKLSERENTEETVDPLRDKKAIVLIRQLSL